MVPASVRPANPPPPVPERLAERRACDRARSAAEGTAPAAPEPPIIRDSRVIRDRTAQRSVIAFPFQPGP
jgi:hypothetical protein